MSEQRIEGGKTDYSSEIMSYEEYAEFRQRPPYLFELEHGPKKNLLFRGKAFS